MDTGYDKTCGNITFFHRPIQLIGKEAVYAWAGSGCGAGRSDEVER
jgi:hypothetical protein